MRDAETTAHMLTASRIRKCLYWMRIRRETIPDPMIESIIRSGVWRQWGYARLAEALHREVGLDVNRTVDWTRNAIEWGCENAESYGG